LRPGDRETGDRIVETIKETLPEHNVEIVLTPLDERMSEALISNMLNISGVHHALIGQIIRRAGGNPYFIEEVVRSFIDEGAVVLRGGKFEVTDKIATISIPNTINDVLMARIDRLEVQARNLVKVASVIGRNFFYRVLSEMATTVQDIDERLSYLKEIELFLERRRMEEQEYLFKHALAQEAAYESILPQKRKELHLKVAGSIEKVFGEKLHEFYGMLAYHCSRGENLDKAEDYLMKAGEEALRSSASNEALHYYQEALTLYLKKNPEVTDPEKVALLEKNIALALFNRGQYVEAIDYFDKALNYYWGKLPQNAVSTLFKFSGAFLHLIISLYLPNLKFKQAPTQRDVGAVDLFYKKCKALAIIDPKRFFLEFLYIYRTVTVFDLTKFELGLEIFMGASALFSFSGISFKLSSKILNAARARIDKNNVKLLINYDFLETIHHYFKGSWDTIKECDDDLVDKNLSIGGIYDASQHLYWHALPNIYRGSLDIVRSLLDRLNNIVEVYDNDFSFLLKYELNINLLIECRQLNDALIELDEAINFVQRANFDIYLFDMYSYKIWLHILMGDIKNAEKFLQQANEVKSGVNAMPIELSSYCRSQLEYHLYRLNASIKGGNDSESYEYSKQAYKSAKALLRVSQKAAHHLTESNKLTGVYYWLIKEQKTALKRWQLAIEDGERLGARLELSRVYFEVGKRLLETESNYKMLNGVTAEEYLKKARSLFADMNLQGDLDEWKIVAKKHDI
jgi:tetratricopeptide (TPR) repeat protein